MKAIDRYGKTIGLYAFSPYGTDYAKEIVDWESYDEEREAYILSSSLNDCIRFFAEELVPGSWRVEVPCYDEDGEPETAVLRYVASLDRGNATDNEEVLCATKEEAIEEARRLWQSVEQRGGVKHFEECYNSARDSAHCYAADCWAIEKSLFVLKEAYDEHGCLLDRGIAFNFDAFKEYKERIKREEEEDENE
jgi:hypothetical protein